MLDTDPSVKYETVPTAIGIEVTTVGSGSGFRRVSGKATASVVLGILALVCGSLILGTIAILLGLSAQASINEKRHELRGECQAKAGIVMGSIAVVCSTVLIVVFVIFGLTMSDDIPDDSNSTATPP